MNIGIVGAGKGSVVYMKGLANHPEIKIVGIVDMNQEAPGMLLAREMGITRGSDISELVKRADVELILELTGSDKVKKIILGCLRENQGIITARGAWMMSEMMTSLLAHRNQKIADEMAQLVNSVSTAIVEVDQASKDINQVLREVRITALNGGIEAARAGTAGAGFAVIAENFRAMTGQVENTLNTIQSSSRKSHEAVDFLREQERILRQAQNSFVET